MSDTTWRDIPGGGAVSGGDPVAAGLDGRLRSGDVRALADAFIVCRPRLLRIAAFRLDERLKSRVSADDVLQEVYVAAAKRIAHYAASEYTSPFLWLRSLLSQTLIDIHRRHMGAEKRSVARETRIDAPRNRAGATSSALAIQIASNATTPGMAFARADMVEMVRVAIGQMEEGDQEVLALRHFEEFSNSEVAEFLDITQKAASIRYVRALRRLRDILAQVSARFAGLRFADMP
jgi:RNA polymerase sigma-70 factor (ECF subfamily)